MTDIQEALIRGLSEAARPFVRRLLAAGVPFGWVERGLRELFVVVAETDFALPGRRATDSRVALLTGINRKEVRRIRGTPAPRRAGTFGMNHVTSLISRWTTDPRTTDRAGQPRVLPYRAARGPSFMRLAHEVTTDLAPGVLLEHLVASGAAEVRDGDRVALRARGFVPPVGSAQQFAILAEDPGELIDTILHNALGEGAPLLQRKVYYDNVGSDAAARVRAQVRREGERFLARLERLLARYDRDRNPRAPGGARHEAGVGVFYFERPRPAPPKGDAREAGSSGSPSGSRQTPRRTRGRKESTE